MRRLECLIPPPLVALIAAFAMWASGRGAPSATLNGIAAALSVCGLALGFAGALTFWRAGANLNPHRIDRGETLVTQGVFRYTRNPMYLGLALLLCGYAVYLSRFPAFLGPLAFVVFIARLQIAPEERAMRGKFGAGYDDYCRRTRRWL